MPKRPASTGDARVPTIRTVASHAGVGVGTVSRVLNGGSVSPEARERVKRVIDELGFTPMTVARGLALRRSNTVGLVVNSTRGSWFAELLAGVEEALNPSGRSVMLASLRLTGKYDPSVVESWIQERRVDGLLFVRSSRRERPLIHAARDSKLPLALIAPDEFTPCDVRVTCDNEKGGALVADHLVALGHQRFAFVGGPSSSRDTRARLRGFSRALNRHGLTLPDEQLLHTSNYYAEAARPYAKAWLSMPRATRPTAVVLASDAMALGFIHTLLDEGIRIPRDVSVAGFDGVPEATLCWPALTTVAQPSRQMARRACTALVKRIDGSMSPQTSHYEMELVVRKSCGPPEN